MTRNSFFSSELMIKLQAPVIPRAMLVAISLCLFGCNRADERNIKSSVFPLMPTPA